MRDASCPPRLWSSRREFGSIRTAGWPLASMRPNQEVDAVLAEEGLVLEYEAGHAPVAGGRREAITSGTDRAAASMRHTRNIHAGHRSADVAG
jgi:hypothetical protein